ncbi:phage antirepressor N-terminal domain-containing protein [Citrobacter freundii]|uniref:phage antirepressor N-terminal domain-containing protein n=1 Tax=Citrobacter freundii TaxID=546 RepID=UPI0029D82C30|nr:phage antirepressor N-terminal domain-containing protein [Citrobacter freundii]MDX7389702.1 phage antirepressor N-terminal domain-containing protein [Citrobacter freundii]
MTSIAILEAVNTSYVPFNGQQIITAMAAGVAYVAMKPIVENLGMSWSTQQTKLMKQLQKFNYVHMNMVAADGKLRKLLCLPLKKLNGWLFSINPEKVRADIRDKLIQYQEECFTVLHEYWTKGKAENPRKKTTVDERTPLRDAVNMLVSKKHLMYPEAYAMIHQRFNVDSIEDLEASQIQQAIEYVHRVVLEGELMPDDKLPAPITRQFTDEELCSLAWLWRAGAVMITACRGIYPLLKVAEHREAGHFYSIGHEYQRTLNKAREVIKRETSHIEFQPWRDDNWSRVLPHLRNDSFPTIE